MTIFVNYISSSCLLTGKPSHKKVIQCLPKYLDTIAGVSIILVFFNLDLYSDSVYICTLYLHYIWYPHRHSCADVLFPEAISTITIVESEYLGEKY